MKRKTRCERAASSLPIPLASAPSALGAVPVSAWISRPLPGLRDPAASKRSVINALLAGLLVLLFFVPTSARGSDAGDEEARKNESGETGTGPVQISWPLFSNIRYEEDWSVLQASSRQNTYERFKFIPLTGTRSSYLNLGGQLRLRGEGWSDFAFGGPGDRDDFYGLSRLRIHGDLHLGSNLRFFVEGKSALVTHRDLPGGIRTADVDSLDLLNAIVDVRTSLEPGRLTFRVGRQELQFGRQRLVSPLDWSNTRRTFDGARIIFERENWKFEGFWSKLVDVRKYSLNRSTTSGVDFFGIYGTARIGGKNHSLDAYWLGLDNNNSSFGGVSGKENRHTIGGRVYGTISEQRLEYDLEASFQSGDHAGRSVRASMLAAQVAYRALRPGVGSRVYLGLDYASGDNDPNDGKLGTFNQLFPLGHAYLGYIDIVGRQNIVDLNQGVTLSLQPRWDVSAETHNFWRSSTADGLYSAGGALVRPGELSDSRYIGWEIDLTTAFRINRFYLLSGGYSHIFPGKSIRESGPADATDFVFLVFQTTF